jgi:branched-chain amino acid transport system substrate-binding protein
MVVAMSMLRKQLMAISLVLVVAACGGGGGGADESSGPIKLGLPVTLSGAFGVADHKDWSNGVEMAVEEINEAGGVDGRDLEIETVDTDPTNADSITSGFLSLADKQVHAILSPFVLVPQPAMDTAASYGAPYLHGNTQQATLDLFASDPEKYGNAFQLDTAEVWYGRNFVPYLDELEGQGWEPKNNKVHIVAAEIGYTQLIASETEKAIEESGGKWELAETTQITSPVQDWGPVIQQLHDTDAGVVMIDHYIAAEEAAFAKAWAANPVEGALVYIQYGPSQPEFLQLAGAAAEGMIFGASVGVLPDEEGNKFREAYAEKYDTDPGTMGTLYNALGYDAVYILKEIWEENGTTDFTQTIESLRALDYKGVTGKYSFNDEQAAKTYPGEVGSPDEGQPLLWEQVQQGGNVIILPAEVKQAELAPQPWW